MHVTQAMYIDVPVSREQPQALREKRHSHIHALTHTPTNYKHACNHTDTLDYLPRVYKYTLQSKVYYFFWLQIGLFSKRGSVTYSNVWQDCQKIRDAITAAEPRLERAKVRVTILSIAFKFSWNLFWISSGIEKPRNPSRWSKLSFLPFLAFCFSPFLGCPSIYSLMPNESDQSTVYQEEYEVQIIDDNAEKEGSIKKGKLILQRVVLPALLLVAAGSAVAFQAGCYLTGIERRRRERWKEEREREKKRTWEMRRSYAFLIGSLFAGTNAAMNHFAGRSFSSFANFCTGLMLCLLGFAIDLIAFRTAPPRISNLRGSIIKKVLISSLHRAVPESWFFSGAPWYSWLGEQN